MGVGNASPEPLLFIDQFLGLLLILRLDCIVNTNRKRFPIKWYKHFLPVMPVRTARAEEDESMRRPRNQLCLITNVLPIRIYETVSSASDAGDRVKHWMWLRAKHFIALEYYFYNWRCPYICPSGCFGGLSSRMKRLTTACRAFIGAHKAPVRWGFRKNECKLQWTE